MANEIIDLLMGKAAGIWSEELKKFLSCQKPDKIDWGEPIKDRFLRIYGKISQMRN